MDAEQLKKLAVPGTKPLSPNFRSSFFILCVAGARTLQTTFVLCQLTICSALTIWGMTWRLQGWRKKEKHATSCLISVGFMLIFCSIAAHTSHIKQLHPGSNRSFPQQQLNSLCHFTVLTEPASSYLLPLPPESPVPTFRGLRISTMGPSSKFPTLIIPTSSLCPALDVIAASLNC